MLFMLSSISLFISAQGEVIDGLFAQKKSLTPNVFQPHPQPLPEEGGEQLAVKMEEVILGLKGCGDMVDN